MLGWKILFMNPVKKKTRWSLQQCKKTKVGSYDASYNTGVPTYWWWFKRVFVGKIYSHLPHTSLVRRCAWGGGAQRREQRWLQAHTALNLISHPSCSPADLGTAGLYQCSPLIKHNNGGGCWRNQLHVPLLSVTLFYAVTFLHPGDFLSLPPNHFTKHTSIKAEENEIVIECAVLSQNSCV